MDIEKINGILSCMNLELIQKALEKEGYRNASKHGEWEFDPISIANATVVENSKRYEDLFDDKIYVADIHTKVKEYPDFQFIVITVNRIYRDKENLEMPIDMLLFTNAPVNQEYEKEHMQIFACSTCKKKFPKSSLCEINGRFICDDCFNKDLKLLITKGKSKIVKNKKP